MTEFVLGSSSQISLNDSDDFIEDSAPKRRKPPSSPSKKRTKLSSNVNSKKSIQQTLSFPKQSVGVLSENVNDQISKESLYFVNSQPKEPAASQKSLRCNVCGAKYATDTLRSSHQKRCAKKIETQMRGESIENQNQLALSAAISLSLCEPTVTVVDKEVYDSQKATLQTYGFTVRSVPAATASKITAPRRKKFKRASVLKSRTEVDRKRLIVEKTAIVLQRCLDFKLTSEAIISERMSKPPSSPLWRFASSACLDYPCYFAKRDSQEDVGNSLESLSQDWSRLVGSHESSDALIATSDGVVPVHRQVFAARCPSVDFDSFKTSRLSITSNAFLSILEFLYSGKLGAIDEAVRPDCVKFAKETLQRSDLVDLLENSTGDVDLPEVPSLRESQIAECDTFPVPAESSNSSMYQTRIDAERPVSPDLFDSDCVITDVVTLSSDEEPLDLSRSLLDPRKTVS